MTSLPEIPQTVTDLIQWLASPIVIGAIFSFLIERVPLFQRLGSTGKALLAFVISAGLGLVSFVLLMQIPRDTIEALNPWWAAMVSAFLAFYGSQWWHDKFQRDKTPIITSSHTARYG